MSDKQTVFELNEYGDLGRVSVLSNRSDGINSSLSSRSTLIRDLLTSEESKQLVDEIDQKIVSLVNIIKSKKYTEKRKKYYAKKIVNRIVDNKYPDDSTTVNTVNFGQQSFPTSTPYDNAKERSVERVKSLPTEGAGDLNDALKQFDSTNSILSKDVKNSENEIKPLPKKQIDDVKDLSRERNSVPKTCTCKNLNYKTTPDIRSLPGKLYTNDSKDSVAKCSGPRTNKELEISERLKFLTKKLQKSKNKDKSPDQVSNTSKNFDLEIPQLVSPYEVSNQDKKDVNPCDKQESVKDDDSWKKLLAKYIPQKEHSTNSSKEHSPLHLANSTMETETLINQIAKHVAEVKSSLTNNKIPESESTNELIRMLNEDEPISELNLPINNVEIAPNLSEKDNKKQEAKENGANSLTSRYQRMVNDINTMVAPEYDNFVDLTPRTLCEIYKIEFNDTSSSHKIASTSSNEDQLDNLVTQSKDWKYFKTTSEKLFERKKNIDKEIKNRGKDYAVKYAKREKDRQIVWINNEIKCLSKLKNILEETSVENLSHTEDSTSSTQYKHTTCLVESESSASSGTKTLKEINICLDELRKILQEKKSNKTIKCSPLNTDTSSSKEKNSSKNSSDTPETPIKTQINPEMVKDNIQISSEESSTSYKKIGSPNVQILDYFPKGFKKPTEFEVKYFQENTLSSRTCSNESNKENLSEIGITEIQYEMPYPKDNIMLRNMEVQTSFCNTPTSNQNKEVNTSFQTMLPLFGQRSVLSNKLVQTSLNSSATNSQQSSNKPYASLNKNFEDSSLQKIFHMDEKRSDSSNKMLRRTSSSSSLLKSRSVAYFLTFEEVKNGDLNGNLKKSKSALEKIVVKIPSKPKISRNSLKSQLPDLELQECLSKHKSDFIRSAEWRRQCINELMYMRDKKSEDFKQTVLFTTKEMKNITSKRYNQTEEVQNKLKVKKSELQRVFNRQLATIFSKKLQEKTLKGQVTISTSKTVVYS